MNIHAYKYKRESTKVFLGGSMSKTKKNLTEEIPQFNTRLSDGELAQNLILKAALNRSLHHYLKGDIQRTRWTFSAELSRLTGREISKNMIDQYVAEGKEDYRLPAELMTAWCWVAQSIEPIAALIVQLNYHLLSEAEWEKIELMRLMDEREELDRKIREFQTKRRA